MKANTEDLRRESVDNRSFHEKMMSVELDEVFEDWLKENCLTDHLIHFDENDDNEIAEQYADDAAAPNHLLDQKSL